MINRQILQLIRLKIAGAGHVDDGLQSHCGIRLDKLQRHLERLYVGGEIDSLARP